MLIHARQLSVEGPHQTLLPPTSLRLAPGQVALVKGMATECTAFGLALTGRMPTATGAVLLDGRSDDATLRRRSAVVDAPEVTEPDPALTFSAVLAEEIDYTAGPGGKHAVASWLRRLGAVDYADARIESVPAAARTQALLELAAARPGVRLLVLDSPDRHSPDPNDWWPHALHHAHAGCAVAVLCGHATAAAMGVPAATIGELDQPEPTAIGVPGEQDTSGDTVELPLDGTEQLPVTARKEHQ